MKINKAAVLRDVVVVGGIAESVLSVAAAVAPGAGIPAADVAIFSGCAAGVAAVVSAADQLQQGGSILTVASKLVTAISGLFHKTPKPAPAKPTPAPAPAAAPAEGKSLP